MKDFTLTVLNEEHEVMTEAGFETAVVVKIDEEYHYDDMGAYWQVDWKKVVSSSSAAEAYQACSKGLDVPYSESKWPVGDSYYWLVRRENGSFYPWPLLFSSQEERVASAARYNDQQWDAFYSGGLPSPKLVDVPSNEEIQRLLTQVEAHIHQGGTPWDDLDARGGLVPRWAA